MSCDGPPLSLQQHTLVVLRVLRATLTISLDNFGKMDPYVKVFWISGDGKTWEASTTRVHIDGHTEPIWDHTCRGQPYHGKGSGDSVQFDVLEQDMISSDDCGCAIATVDDLLGNLELADGEVHAQADELTLPIVLGGKSTGALVVQALLVRVRGETSEQVSLAEVPSDMFETPVKRIGVSGGTAPFFSLVLRNPGPMKSISHYIGKDLSRASDEVDFYEKVLLLSKTPHAGGLRPLINFMPEYLGILTTLEAGQELNAKPKELLVMRNMLDGCKKLRLLDIKIGQKTAQAGWKGKPMGSALRQTLMDGLTNSTAEGFRLEGFDSRPPSLASMDPLMDLGVKNPKLAKKGSRIMFQRMTGAEVLMHFLDVHQEPADPGCRLVQDLLSPTEVSEYVLAHIVKRMTALAVACRQSPVPQKWIGSSVALGFDVGTLPQRSAPLPTLLQSVKVHIFDWGRSELNTLAHHHEMSDKDLRDRAEYWGYYRGGIDRLSWEVARTYRHRFCVSQWEEIQISIWDFDSMSMNDPMCRVIRPLTIFPFQKVSMGDACLTLSIDWRSYERTQDSRLEGEWRVKIGKATNLPLRDRLMMKSTSDPFCEIVAMSRNRTLRFTQVSCVLPKTLDPEWNETFTVPVSSEGDATLTNILREERVDTVEDELTELFPSGDDDDDPQTDEQIAVSRGFASWRNRLDETAKKPGVVMSESEIEIDTEEADAVERVISQKICHEDIVIEDIECGGMVSVTAGQDETVAPGDGSVRESDNMDILQPVGKKAAGNCDHCKCMCM
eukprot:TRINITY_DN10290_c0_g1_i1.p1 TRINITY_DN10290_c0_g1~~TRINITY_DN10290_c0_g1_i1.p1  ORF type:complete len:782 (-),score=113.37 TRINITY_DN10290_c0_g1_i1:48-2393(-)